MTVCKTFTRVPLVKGQEYKRADLISNLAKGEGMYFTYYDPPRDELRTFFEEDNDDWVIAYDETARIFRFRHRAPAAKEETPAWERTKIRHVFLHRKSQSKGKYKYLGTAIDESKVGDASRDERQFDIQ